MKTITTKQYNRAIEKSQIYNKWAKQFAKKNGWTVIPASEKPPVDYSNKDRSSIEVYEFVHNPPDKYFLYVEEPSLGIIGKAHTWMGEELGACHFGCEYRDNFGGTRRPVTVYGINGVTYHGTYFKSAGDFARIKRTKNKNGGK